MIGPLTQPWRVSDLTEQKPSLKVTTRAMAECPRVSAGIIPYLSAAERRAMAEELTNPLIEGLPEASDVLRERCEHGRFVV